MSAAIVIELLLAYSQSVALVLLGSYLAYEIRLGALKEVRESQRMQGIALYRVIERDEELDEMAFREALWDDGDDGLFADDLMRGGE